MTTHYLDLDFVDSSDIGAESYGLTSEVLQEHGPAGGNPLVRLTGPYDNLTDYVWCEYCSDDENTAEFLASLIKELSEV